MNQSGQARIVRPPETGGILVSERRDHQFQAGPAAQRGVPGEEFSHDGHG
ncbi:MAG: hypothetical protein ACRDNZ_14450 [Streptosporangiaceae bacterium]